MKCVVCNTPVSNMEACARCGLVQKAPMPSKEEIASLYHEDLEHFEPYIEQLPVHRKYFFQKLQEIKNIIPHTSLPISLLDIGCAMGVLLEEAKEMGYRAQGVDISKDAVLYCKKKGFQVSKIWPKKKRFDVITAFEVIEHERDPLGMMRRVHALLKSGGMVILTTPNHSSIWRNIMGKWWVGYHHPEHITFWDPKSLKVLMETAGFTHIEVHHDTPRPFPLSFLFTRSADYFPWVGGLLRPIGKLLDHFKLVNPVNPWDDLIVYATK